MKPTAPHLTLGKQGERVAEDYLKEKGYKLRHRNWQYQKQEIDLVMEDKEFTVIVEVKTRCQSPDVKERFGEPARAVGKEKQRLLRGAGALYRAVEKPKKPIRFDVVEVLFSPTAEGYSLDHIHHMMDAFS